MASLPEALEQYRGIHLTGRNLAPRTRIEYVNDLKQLLAFLEAQGFGWIDQVEANHLRLYLAQLDSRGLKGSTRRRKIAAIRSFFGFLHAQGLLTDNPTQFVVLPELEEYEPKVLTTAEYRLVRELSDTNMRDRAIIELLLQTGVRLNELSQLRLSDVTLPAKISADGQPGSLHVRGKGRKERTVTLNWKAAAALKKWLAMRGEADTDRLFLTRYRQGITPRSIQKMVTRYLTQAGIVGASVHSLRHTFATQQVKAGTTLSIVRDMLGHADIKTTSIYVGLARDLMDKEIQEHAL
jgi:site-specific recombinase XerD